MSTSVRRKRAAVRNALIALFAMILAFVAAPTVPALAANPYERGPAPTTASIEATTGYFATTKLTVARSSVTGFGGGTIYYPTSTTAGTFGAVAIVPGFTNVQSAVAWLGPRIASQGFVVFIIDTNSVYDQPDSRGTQLLAALDYLTKTSTVKSRIDAARLGVMGYSMGGGGALSATRTRTTLKASVPMAPYHGTKSWSGVRTPTLIIAGESDTVAPPSSHALPFYTSLPTTLDRAYLLLNNATHSAPTSANVTIAKYSISWLKRFIDDDTRYDQFLCPNPSGTAIQEWRSNCPYS
ncbi:alpha/beta hydrolase family protein [Paractinoplanes toevensis]|uniref:Lipase n=1 Tax=Paractinoplanes toevensis TaxID=571911 RepID=A0A919TIB8_9ACTN|nr:dienelactone hydrolase family protein [Actinoplanes toevensis]GIM94436.1 lipase [Actinoplanes toevensis]